MNITPPRTFFYIENFAEVGSVGTFEGIRPKIFRENRIVSGHIGPSSAIVHEAVSPRHAFTSWGKNRILIHLAGDIVEAFLATPTAAQIVIKHNGNFPIADEMAGQLYAQLDQFPSHKFEMAFDARDNPKIFDYFGHHSVIVEIL